MFSKLQVVLIFWQIGWVRNVLEVAWKSKIELGGILLFFLLWPQVTIVAIDIDLSWLSKKKKIYPS